MAIEPITQVTPNLYRSGQPTDAQWPTIKALGIQTILTLRQEVDLVVHERNVVEQLYKMRLFNVSMPGWMEPSVDEMMLALTIIATGNVVSPTAKPINHTILVHCEHGEDRTGCVIACYRISYQGWNAHQATEEAEAHHMSEWSIPMKIFIHQWAEKYSLSKKSV